MNWHEQHQPRFDAVTARIHPHVNSILEVGADPYDFTEEIVDASADADIYAISLGTAGEYETQVNGESVTVRECNAETDTWPYDDDSMDIVLLGAIIEHFLDPKHPIQEAHRVCKPTGKVIITTPNAVRLHTRLKTLLGTNPYDGFAQESVYHRHNHEWTESELRDILSSLGFHRIQVQTVTLNREGIIGDIFAWVTSQRRQWDDQYVVFCSPDEPKDEPTQVYRESVVSRRG